MGPMGRSDAGSAGERLRLHSNAPAPDTSNRLRADQFTTLLEASLPFRELSKIAAADKANADPAYTVHRWWARRPPGVMRGLLLAAAMPASSGLDDFWSAFASVEHALAGMRVHDPFVGGGSTLVEAARLGATPSGTDVDPLAVEISSHELDPPDREPLRTAAKALFDHVESVAHRYFAGASGWAPLHWFALQLVKCPGCKVRSALYRSLVIARDVGKVGGVVRDCDVVAFCPCCFDIKSLQGANRQKFDCCGRRHRLDAATYAAFRFTCPHCERRTQHAELLTANAPRKLIAIEETKDGHRRRIRKANGNDLALASRARAYVSRNRSSLSIPREPLATERHDARPLSYGITHPEMFLTSRQLLVFGTAFRWLETADIEPTVRRALRLVVSNALTNNNRLCGYATDYGRLAPLFSVRSYSLPALSVELNPFHRTAGRGTLHRLLTRIEDEPNVVRRHVWSTSRRRTIPIPTTYAPAHHATAVECRSATEPPPEIAPKIDICVFDPPYFDYIAYSELSEFYRVWLGRATLGGTPLMPSQTSPVTSFATILSASLRSVLQRMRPGAPLAFTYHAASNDAWTAIGEALDAAKLTVTALWPLRNDGHAGHHTTAGNCEWDVVVVARDSSRCEPATMTATVSSWLWDMKPFTTKPIDKKNFGYAISMASTRFGRLKKITPES